MTPEALTLALTAFVLGLVHTALGPDHYLPFLALARSRGWSLARTLAVTLVCGAGHIASSILVGAAAFAGGWVVADLSSLDEARGSVAGWMLLGLGLAYTLWGVRRAFKKRRHSHFHVHVDGTAHRHPHDHHGAHAHIHAAGERSGWAARGLFLVFVFGPCEPLIPLFLYPAARGDSLAVLGLVVVAFAVATLGTMALLVAAGYHAAAGLARRTPPALEHWSHAAAGVTIVLCGILIRFGL